MQFSLDFDSLMFFHEYKFTINSYESEMCTLRDSLVQCSIKTHELIFKETLIFTYTW